MEVALQLLLAYARRLILQDPRCAIRASGLPVDLDGAGLEDDHVAPVLQGGHVVVEGPPLVGDEGHSAGRAKRLRNPLALEGGRIGMPTDLLAALALGETLQESDAVALGVPAIDVVEDERPMAMTPQLTIQPKDRQVAFEPAGLARQG